MNENQEHLQRLLPRARSMVNKSDEERINFINQGVFINYKVSEEISKELLELFEQPIRPRMTGLLIVSPTNNGKTTLIKKFINDFSNRIKGNLVYVETPERTTLKEFYAETLNVLGYPARATRSTGDIRRQILVALENKKVKMLFFDEIHNLLDSRRDHKRDVLNGLKSLNNRAQIPIVLIGIETATDILSLDDQVKDRYPAVEIPLWENNEEFKDILGTFEANLPLKKPSNLYEDRLANLMIELSEGKLGRVSEIIRICAIKAITDGEECITRELIKQINWRWGDHPHSLGAVGI